MYLGIDIGGTKTLVAAITANGQISQKLRFETPKEYKTFIQALAENVADLSTNNFLTCGVGVPGRLDRQNGKVLALGNLPWRNVPIKKDIEAISKCSVVVENDAKLAGLSEAMLLKSRYQRVLFVTISTGIGVGLIVNQQIEPALADSEGGQVLVNYRGKEEHWEEVASGDAIVHRYGKRASEITDPGTWEHIAADISLGLSDLIAVIQPEVIVLGGSVGAQFDRFEAPLLKALHRYELPITKVPPIVPAARPDEAVLFGCYDLAKATYARTNS